MGTKFEKYVVEVTTTDCKESLQRLLKDGPPVNFKDSALPCDNERKEVHSFFFEATTKTAKLDGAVDGAARITFWAALKVAASTRFSVTVMDDGSVRD